MSANVHEPFLGNTNHQRLLGNRGYLIIGGEKDGYYTRA